jgi:tight adherence protein B
MGPASNGSGVTSWSMDMAWVGTAEASLTVLVGLLAARFVATSGERRAIRTAGVQGLLVLGGRAVSAPRARERVEAWMGATRPVRWRADRKAVAERTRLLPDFVHAVSRTLTDGAPLRTAFVDGAHMVGEPFETDIARLIARAGIGLSLTDAVERWAAEVGGDDLQLFATACVLGAESGRGTAEALAGVAVTLADRREVEAETHALTSQARSSAWMLAGLPVAFTLLMSFVDPSTLHTLLATPIGLVCLVAGLGLDTLGAWWMHRMIGAVT